MLENIIGITHKTIPIIACVEAVHSTKLVDDKSLRVDIAAISEYLTRTEVSEIKWSPGNKHLVDCMTKCGAAGYNLLNILKDGRLPQDFLFDIINVKQSISVLDKCGFFSFIILF